MMTDKQRRPEVVKVVLLNCGTTQKSTSEIFGMIRLVRVARKRGCGDGSSSSGWGGHMEFNLPYAVHVRVLPGRRAYYDQRTR